ncbi:MAG: ABC transporter permease [Pyrinomonadaceae bacterium]
MNKLFVIIKREYLQRVRSKFFIVSTVVTPLLMIVFAVVPGLLFSIKTGGPTRIAVWDQTGQLGEHVRGAIMHGDDGKKQMRDASTSFNDATKNATDPNVARRMNAAAATLKSQYEIELVNADNRSNTEVAKELSAKVLSKELNAYIILPKDILETGRAEYYGRSSSDTFSADELKEPLTNVIVEQRMLNEKIDPAKVQRLSQRVTFDSQNVTPTGIEKDAGQNIAVLVVAFLLGFFIYFTIISYGQMILAAVVEEKNTRIGEVLFSSVRPFTLMMGKLVGVSLVALTQYAIWTIAAVAVLIYTAASLAASGVNLPHLAPLLIIYFFLFFLLGYFIYATLYVLIGSMVTTTQEAGQISFPVIMLLMTGFYLMFVILRNPNSSLAFWVSLVPFFSPITMIARIVTEQPPFWQIALSLVIGTATVLVIMWFAARIYRTGMLMYGKRATLPEVWRWIKQP